MASVEMPLKGGCQCGKLRYELSAPPITLYACHCTNCQKQTGSAFVLSAAVIESSFSFTEGEPAKVEWTADSGANRYGLFCGDCGGRICNGQTPSIGILSLRAGTADDKSWMKPAAHIWVKSAQSWFRFAEDDLLFDGQPTDYSPAVERFQSYGFFPV
ncbi:GFA family protein [Hyphococcus flavus]|uniref:GFA family protein n=1 Tax=Hyphococcus flavus TaxID=1866326 RepID=A0AAF0CG53_9PROT|nr:GFA family protein [Hyphococcus flavus]WDI30327.1 GFA family protein [Hyphococcus flavus]